MNNISHIKTFFLILLLLVVFGILSFLAVKNPFGTPVAPDMPQNPPDLTGIIQDIREGSMIVKDPVKAGPTPFPQKGVYAVLWTPHTKFFKLLPKKLAPGESIADVQRRPNTGEVVNAASLKEGQSVWIYKESIQRRIPNISNLPEIYASVIVINP